jgi:hypothetical protein
VWGQRGREGSLETTSPRWRHPVGGDLSTVARYDGRGGRLRVRGGSWGDGEARGGASVTGGRLERAACVRPSRRRKRLGRCCTVDGVSSGSSGQPSGEGGYWPHSCRALRGTMATQPRDGAALRSRGGVEQRSDRGSARGGEGK